MSELSAAFMAIAEYALAHGVKNLKALPGCWESQIDDRWWLAVNGHETPHATSQGIEIPKFSAYVEFNGWPAGMLDPFGGAFAAGELANEDSFIAALKAATPE